MVRRAQERALRVALDGVDERCRAVLLLVAAGPRPDGRLIAEAAGVAACSAGAARGRCLALLRRRMAEAGW
ncbi:hypothetical protein APASM_6731 [Actinosynnema pretiosum subsp. pretiosum]|nr:hypothetical protein APASM_6731 [Actinosynnema pretiosum subsp. pretiosum]